MLSEVTMLQYLAVRAENRVCEVLVIDVYPEDVASSQYLFLLGKIRADFERRGQSEGLANPPTLDQRFESQKIQVLLDRNCDPVTWIQSQFNKEKLELS